MGWVEHFFLDISEYQVTKKFGEMNRLINRYVREGWTCISIEGNFVHFQKQHG